MNRFKFYSIFLSLICISFASCNVDLVENNTIEEPVASPENGLRTTSLVVLPPEKIKKPKRDMPTQSHEASESDKEFIRNLGEYSDTVEHYNFLQDTFNYLFEKGNESKVPNFTIKMNNLTLSLKQAYKNIKIAERKLDKSEEHKNLDSPI